MIYRYKLDSLGYISVRDSIDLMIFNHFDVIGPKSNREIAQKSHYAFKVIPVHRFGCQSKAQMWLPTSG